MTRYAFAVDASSSPLADGADVPDITFAFGATAKTVSPGAAFIGPDGVSRTDNWIELSSAPARTAIGLYPVTEDPAPDGQVVASEMISVAGARPVATSTFADAPPAARRLIPKSIVLQRVDDAGKFDPVYAAFQTQPKLLMKWNSPDWPNVFFDDETMLTVLNAVGCTSDQIAAITAPYPDVA